MAVSNFYLAIIVGLCLSLFIEMKLGVSPGGLVVPSYLALIFDNVAVLLNIFLVAILTFLFVKYILSRFMLLYGKRRFTACILVSLLFKLLLDLMFPLIPFSVFAFNGFGVITSGIIANTYFKQGVPITTIVTIVTSGIVFLIMNMIYLF
jgi:poly-gamma-glutamate biosynthesis protein PgsC/CapC